MLVDKSDLSESGDIVRYNNKNKYCINSFFNALKWPLYARKLCINTLILLPLMV